MHYKKKKKDLQSSCRYAKPRADPMAILSLLVQSNTGNSLPDSTNQFQTKNHDEDVIFDGEAKANFTTPCKWCSRVLFGRNS